MNFVLVISGGAVVVLLGLGFWVCLWVFESGFWCDVGLPILAGLLGGCVRCGLCCYSSGCGLWCLRMAVCLGL